MDSDIVVHAAAIAGIDTVIKKPTQTMLINMIGTANTLQVALENNVKDRFLDFSTSEVFGSMAIKFRLMERANPRDPQTAKKFYAIASSDGEVTLRQLADRIAEISTVSSIDTLAVLESLLSVIPNFLLQGYIVRLGDFGTFRLTISSDGAETEKDFSKDLVKSANLNFRPGKQIRNDLKTADFQKIG